MGKFLDKHYEMCERGDHNHEGNNVQWDYISSLFFTGTILTTIGNYWLSLFKHNDFFCIC
jgi:hypothetical protein